MENCKKVVFHSKKERKMSMRKRIVRQVIAMVLCVCMALGLFDGIPVVKEYVRTSTEAEAAANPYVGTYNNCTWTAWKKAYELTGVQLPGFRGNAVGWYQGAINAGYTVSSVPREKVLLFGKILHMDTLPMFQKFREDKFMFWKVGMVETHGIMRGGVQQVESGLIRMIHC